MINVITDNNSLKNFCALMAKEEFITVDTEFMREKTYYPELCLIQVAGETEAAIIDPLAKDIDLKPLYEIFANTHILKVFHACRQDMEIFYHAMNAVPAPIFDTQIAAMVCGYGESASYESLVNKIAGKSVDKSSRFTDWSRRPLSDKQLEYALDDVLHLRDIYKALVKELENTARTHWITEEMQPLLQPETYDTDPNESWRKLRLRNSSPRYIAFLQAASCWRELTARERNVPRGRIMKDEVLTEVAQTKPENFSALQDIRGFHPSMAAIHYEPLFTIMRETNAMPAAKYPKLPPKPQVSVSAESLIDLLRLLLKARAGQNKVVPRLIADKDELELLALGKRENLHVLQGWRHEIFGQYAVKLLKGEIALKADENSGIAFINL